jgi:molybdopterin converting factor small subunit
MKNITIRIRLFSDFINYQPDAGYENGVELTIEDGITVSELIRRIKIPSDKRMVITVNDSNQNTDYKLREGDLIKVLPAAMGG